MAGRSLAFAVLLAGLSFAAGLIAPVEPFPSQQLFVASPDAPNLFAFDATGESVPANITGLQSVAALAFGPDGALYAADTELHRVLVFDAAGQELASWGEGTDLDGPTDLAFGPAGGLYVTSSNNDVVLRFERDGSVAQTVGEGSGLVDPRGLAFSPDGRLWVSSFATDQVLAFDRSGLLVDGIAHAELQGPHGLAFAPSGRLLVASHGNDLVHEFALDGTLVASFGAGTGLSAPTSLVIGPDRRRYVASSGSDSVLVMDDEGALVDTLGHPDLTGPTGLAFSPTVFHANLKGRMKVPGAADSKFSAPARVTWSPGSGLALLLLTGGPDALAEMLGSDALVLHGFEVTESDGSKTRHLVAREITGDAQAASIATLGLILRGGLDDGDGFAATKGTGDLLFAGPSGAIEAALKLKREK